MADIAIFDLNPVGADLFIDSENFMADLSQEDELLVKGGGTPILSSYLCGVAISGAITAVGSAIGSYISGAWYG